MTDEYNGMGIRKNQPFDKNPKGNDDIVWNSAKRPQNPGTFLPGQAISDLTFMSGYSQRRIRITMNPGDNPVQDPGSIAIMNENGDILWSAGDAQNNAINFVRPQTDITGILIIPQVETTAPMERIDIGFPASSSDGLQINNQGTGRGIDIETTTGDGIRILTDGGWPLSIRDANPVGGVFERSIKFTNGAGPVLIVSDGTDPNGVLTAPIGSVCLNTSVTGQMSYNTDGGTTWVML